MALSTAAFDTEAEQKRLSELFAQLNGASQTLYGGFLQANTDADDKEDGSAQVQLVWGKKDLVNNATQKFHVQYHVSGLSGGDREGGKTPKVQRGIFPSSWDVAISSVSPSKRFVVTLKLEKSAGSDASAAPEGVFSLYQDAKLLNTFRTPKSLHGTIYLGEREGGLVWSHDETRVAYVAEKKSAESAPFWENVNSAKVKTVTKSKDTDADGATAGGAEKKSDDAAVLPGNKYVHEDDWGEQYVGKKTGVIFLATLATGKVEEVKGVPPNLTCADVQFTPNDAGLVFAGTETTNPKRLGIIYCYNRPITLYHLPFDSSSSSTTTTSSSNSTAADDKSSGKDTPAVTDDAKPATLATKIEIVPTDDAAKQIASMRSPRFSPDGSQLAFYATRDVVTHSTCSMLAVLDWETKRVTTVIDVVDEPAPGFTARPATAFNGLFTGSLGKKAWSKDGTRIFFDTQVGTRFLWKYVDVATKTVVSPQYVEGVDSNSDSNPDSGDRVAMETVLDRDDNSFLVSVSSPVRPSSVFLVSVDLATGRYTRAPVTIEDQRETSQHIGDWKVLAIPTAVSDAPAALKKLPETPAVLKEHLIPSVTSDADFEATVLLPASDAPAEGYPVVIDLHGGPHGNSPAIYRVLYEYFAALGFAVVSVNYRGSTGYGIRPLESLVGKVGTQDIFDCHYALQHILETSGLPLNKSKVHCSGGSHGGFIVGHLIGQFPGFYRSTVSRNPVSNIASMFYLTDIPDWTLGATGIKRFESIHSSQALQNSRASLPPLSPEVRLAILSKLWLHSPVSNDLSQVTTPVLFGIGGKDRRVPPTQGLELRDSIAAYGVETRTLWYPEDNHPLDTLQAYGDFAVNWALWLVQHN